MTDEMGVLGFVFTSVLVQETAVQNPVWGVCNSGDFFFFIGLIRCDPFADEKKIEPGRVKTVPNLSFTYLYLFLLNYFSILTYLCYLLLSRFSI